MLLLKRRINIMLSSLVTCLFNQLLKQTKPLRSSRQYLSVVWLFCTTPKECTLSTLPIKCQLRSLTLLLLTLKKKLQTRQNVRLPYLLIPARTDIPTSGQLDKQRLPFGLSCWFFTNRGWCHATCNQTKPNHFFCLPDKPRKSSPNYKGYELFKIWHTNAFWGS